MMKRKTNEKLRALKDMFILLIESQLNANSLSHGTEIYLVEF